MSHSRGALARPVAHEGLPTSAIGAGASLYIINLSSANTPMLLEAPDIPELGGFAVFRSRRVEDGRERFRLHLGYFDSQEQAEKFMPLLRERYPSAWVAQAPKDSMGSLDDTNVAQFKFIPQKAEAAPVAQAPVVTAPASPPSLAPGRTSATTIPASQFLEAEDVLSLLESAPRTLPSVETNPVPAPVAKAPAVAPAAPKAAALIAKPASKPVVLPTEQSFAVQLIWSTNKPDTAQLPRLAIFDAYTMYTVTVQRGGRVWYGLRLGFFNDPVSARQVALYVRSDFDAASVVPVSERECGRAEEAAKVVQQKEAAARQQHTARPEPAWASTLKLQDEPKAAMPVPRVKPTTEVASAQQQFRKSLENMDRPLPAPKAKVKAKKPASSKPATSTDQLIEELGAHAMSLEDEEGSTFTDTGVRHLSVAVMKPTKKKGFFSRK